MEDVHHEVDVVEKDPSPRLVAFHVPRLQSARAHSLVHGVGDGAGLDLGLAGGEDEVVAHAVQLAKIEDHDVFGPLGEGEPRGRAREILGFHLPGGFWAQRSRVTAYRTASLRDSRISRSGTAVSSSSARSASSAL